MKVLEEIGMTSVKVSLSSIDKVKAFVNDISGFSADFDLVAGRYVIDAKSIMGIFSLDISKPIDLNIYAEDNMDEIMTANVRIAIAGMEGALASVIGGLADCPVIAVPTSVGYGASFGGISALLSMLNSCASGVSVVNIDNGFGAGYLASMINHMN